MLGIILLIIGLTLINGFFAASEMALVSITPSQLYKLKRQNKKHVQTLENVKRDSTKYLSTIQVAITFAGFLSSAFAGSTLSSEASLWLATFNIIISTEVMVVIITVILSFFTLIFGELVPKRIALSKSVSFALFCAPVIRVVMIIFNPFVWFLSISTNGIIKLIGLETNPNADKLTEYDVKEMIVYGHIKGLYPSEETKMLERIFQLDDLTAKMIMTPLQDVVSLYLNDLSKKSVNRVISSRFSRIPVFKDQQKSIKGFFLVKDILLALEDQRLDEIELLPHIRNPLIVDEHITINLLLTQMKTLSIHMAFVVNHKGKAQGIVTLEDIVEEIVGNIYDEHDDVLIKKKYKDYLTYIIDGNMSISDIEHRVGLTFSTIFDKNMLIRDYMNQQIETNKTSKDSSTVHIPEGYFDILSIHDKDILQLRLVVYQNPIH
jgi:putative hemolysin